jgi:hypothetical protein
VAKTRKEDGHRENTKRSTAIQNERKKKLGATKKEIGGPTSSGGLRNRLKRPKFHDYYYYYY